MRIVAAEPAACPTLTRAAFAYDCGEVARMALMGNMHPLGHSFMPAGIHAYRLRYHGTARLERLRKDQGVMEATAVGRRSSRPWASP